MKEGPRKANEPEVMGAKEACEELGVGSTNLYKPSVGLPEPYQVIAATTLWRAEEIRALAKARASRKAA